MQSSIEIFRSRTVFRQGFFVKITKWRRIRDRRRWQPRELIDSDSGECFVDFEAAGTSESTSTLECFRQRILSTE